ncbi:site-specific integrase [Novosphingobium sp.]|uniref:tyrosine-type recombinase/integrase n=1 Tax=Novosphingobium sp. TaxID=1874826 RepID=UPI0025FD521C|nr:site-specific integrase [Novosphingobium sp.]
MKLKTKPNGIYYIDTEVPGEDGQLRRARISLDTRDHAAAEAQRRDWLAGVHAKHPSRATVAAKGRSKSSTSPTAPQGMTMAKLLDMCHSDRRCWADAKSQATIRSNVKLLTARIDDELVIAMTHKRLCQLVDEMIDEGYAPGAVKRKMDMVSKALRMASDVYEDDKGAPLIPAKPKMPAITIRNTKDRVLSHAEEGLVFAAIEKREAIEPSRQWRRFGMFVRVLLDTAFRRSEGLMLGPDSVTTIMHGDQAHTVLMLPIYSTKNDKPRIVPATAAVAALIPALDAQAVTDQRTGKRRWFPMDASAWYMWSNIRDDVKALGGDISDVGLHTLRHTCLTRLAKGGMELQRLSMFAGHSSVTITAERYSHLDAADLLGAVAILGTPPAVTGNLVGHPELSAKGNYQSSSGNRANLGTVTVQ